MKKLELPIIGPDKKVWCQGLGKNGVWAKCATGIFLMSRFAGVFEIKRLFSPPSRTRSVTLMSSFDGPQTSPFLALILP